MNGLKAIARDLGSLNRNICTINKFEEFRSDWLQKYLVKLRKDLCCSYFPPYQYNVFLTFESYTLA
jgi:hypothetical protein